MRPFYALDGPTANTAQENTAQERRKEMRQIGFVKQIKSAWFVVASYFLVGGSLHAANSVLIAEEDFEGGMSCRLHSVGTFPVAPGIKGGMGVGGSSAYGFGRSSAAGGALDSYVNDLVFTFTKKHVITKVEFWEIERYGNWGSEGFLIADGGRITSTGYDFGREPVNDYTADSSFRKREFLMNVVSSELIFRCRDITRESEIFIDNIKVYGYVPDEYVTVSFNANGGIGQEMDDQVFKDRKDHKLSPNTYTKDGYVFQGWATNATDAANGFVKYRDEALITVDHDMTLYAVWANPALTLTAESADWLSGSITLRCTDADMSGRTHTYTLQYYDESTFTWKDVSSVQSASASASLTDTAFSSRLGGIPPVKYRVKDETGRASAECVTRTRHGFAVGLGKYDKSKWGTNPPGGLEQCYNNTDLFAKTMVQDGGIAFSNMKFLHNEEATVENITNEWGNIAGKTKPGDVVFFCIATHGASSGALAAYDKRYTVSEFQKNIEPFRSGNRTGVKLVILLLNCHSESMTSKLKDINFEYGSICTANIIYVAVADAEESEWNLHRDAEEDVEQGKPRDQKYSEGGEFFLNQGLKKRRADALRTLQGIKGEFGNRDGVVDLLECTRYMDALAIGVSDRSQTNAQYDRNKSEIMRKTAMVKGGVTSDISAPPAPHMTNVAVESGVVNIFVDDVASAQYYKIYYQKVGDNVKHWVASSCSGKISVDDGDAVFRTADVSTHKDRKFFVPLENDATYNFYAVAVNAGGQSPESNVIPISTAPATSLPVYRVFLEAEGGTVSPAYLDVKSGLPVGQLPTPSSKGRSFLGWFTASQGGVEVDPEKLIDMDVKYYAHWSKPTTEIYLPEAWLQCYPSISFAADGDTTVATYLMSANGCKTVGECYALGIDPEDPDDDFKVTHFEMKDGKPVITLNHTEDGSGNSFMPRVKTLGKADLSDTEWREVPEDGDDTMRFFKVEVEMP